MLAQMEPLIMLIAGAAAIFGILATVLVAVRDRRRLVDRLSTLEEVLRRVRASDPENQFDERPAESPLELSRERLLLQNLLDRFPAVTQKFVVVEDIEELCRVLLGAFAAVLGSTFGVVFVRESRMLRLRAQSGIGTEQLSDELEIRVGEGRVGLSAANCLIMRPDDFTALDDASRAAVDADQSMKTEFELYVPLIYRGDAIGCVAVGGMTRVVQKSHAVSMALANLGSVVLSNIQRANEIRILSEQDPLTGLNNRRRCIELLAERLETRNTHPFGILLFDVDHFKHINDHWGHGIGDIVLMAIADVARVMVDETAGEFACRFGGDEHLILINSSEIADVAARVEQLRQSIADIDVDVPDPSDKPEVRITGGVAFCPAEEEDVDTLIALADSRLYYAKEHGRDRITIEPTPDEVAAQRA